MSHIRPAGPQDIPGAYRVCLLTGDSGRDASGLYGNPDLLGHVFVGPYIVGQPDLATVVADSQGIGGYVLAAEDTFAFEAWAERAWWPTLREQYPLGEGSSRDDEIVRLIHMPPSSPKSVVRDYPAHLHIDLLERVRGQGMGRRLIEDVLQKLRSSGSPGIHLEVALDNENAIAFYDHLGFSQLEKRSGSLLMGRRL